jgi:PAS domain S-box-containing protein
MANSSGSIFWYNKRWFDYTGTSLADMEGWGWTAAHHPDHVDRVVERIQHSWDTGTPWEDTFPLRAADGQYRWFLSRALPIMDDHGDIKLWFGTNTDITEQREKEGQIEFLLGEMNHRSKNLLAMIQALVRRTLVPRNDAFFKSFEGRLAAVGANLDLLTKRKWVGVGVRELITSQLSYFNDLVGSRIHLDGDDSIVLRPSAAEVIGLAVHELATNAAKYGALSGDNGRLNIDWNLIGDDPEEFAHRWAETEGPAVERPDKAGFGSLVMVRNPTSALSAKVSLNYLPSGLVWELRAPLGRIALDSVNDG